MTFGKGACRFARRAPARRRIGALRRSGSPPVWVWATLVAAFVWGAYPWVSGWRAERLPDARTITIWRADIGQLAELPLETYVKGVVAAEMPASFHPEALAAQAVAARTYALRAIEDGRRVEGHPEAVLTNEPGAGQGWLSEEQLRLRWGYWGFRKYWDKISSAVDRTAGLVAVYDGGFIDAVYHSDSGGRTESSEYYWGNAVPYLQSVDDPYSESSPYRRTTERLPFQIAAAELGLRPTAVGGDGVPVVEVLDRSPSGRAVSVRIGPDVLSGREVRERLGLKSNWFDVESEDGRVTFTVRGYGHGVGMSQYGADGMARNGFAFDGILKHYFTGIDIVSMEKM